MSLEWGIMSTLRQNLSLPEAWAAMILDDSGSDWQREIAQGYATLEVAIFLVHMLQQGWLTLRVSCTQMVVECGALM